MNKYITFGSSAFRIPNKSLRSDGWVERLKVK